MGIAAQGLLDRELEYVLPSFAAGAASEATSLRDILY